MPFTCDTVSPVTVGVGELPTSPVMLVAADALVMPEPASNPKACCGSKIDCHIRASGFGESTRCEQHNQGQDGTRCQLHYLFSFRRISIRRRWSSLVRTVCQDCSQLLITPHSFVWSLWTPVDSAHQKAAHRIRSKGEGIPHCSRWKDQNGGWPTFLRRLSLPIPEPWVPRPFDSAQGRPLRSLQGRAAMLPVLFC